MLLVTDRTLLRRFRDGDAHALKEVYGHYAGRVCGHLRGGFTFTSLGRRLRFRGYQRPYDLENAVQEVFLRAFAPRARLGFDGLRPYGEYLLAIARNVVLNELRRKEALFVEEDKLDEVPQPATEELLEHREVDRLLDAFVATLDERQHGYYRVRFQEGRNQAEAARALGINRIVARRLEARIKSELLAHMKAHGYLEGVPAGIVGSLATVRR